MKSLIKYVLNTNSAIALRNLLNIRPVPLSITHIKGSTTVSDAFCWRTDSEFKTTFNFIDILRLYYNIRNTEIEIIFCDKNNNNIKELKLESVDLANKLVIDQRFMDSMEDYGVFYVYHRSKNKSIDDVIISNRCYLGFSYKNMLSSFAHGNTHARYRNITGGSIKADIVKKSLLLNQEYRIQNYFKDMTKSELFFANPINKNITLSVNNNLLSLDPGCSRILNVTNDKEVNIRSNCCFIRPLIFNYKGDYMDVYHG